MKRKSTLGFVVSLHLALFSNAAAAATSGSLTGAPAAIAFGVTSAIVLAVTLFYEVSVPA